MNAKVRTLDNGRSVYVELDGKTMGEGVDLIEYKKKGSDPAELTIYIYNTDDFQFHLDGTFDMAENCNVECASLRALGARGLPSYFKIFIDFIHLKSIDMDGNGGDELPAVGEILSCLNFIAYILFCQTRTAFCL